MDVLLTVAVIGVLAGLVVTPVQEAVSRYRLGAAAAMVASELRTARSLAMTHGSVVEVSFNRETRSLQVRDLADPSNPARHVKSLAEGVDFSSVPSVAIRFFPRGFVRGGTVALQNHYGDRLFVVLDPSGLSRVAGSEPNSTS